MTRSTVNPAGAFSSTPAQSVGDAYRLMIRAFESVGIDTAALDARLLLSEFMEIEAAALISDPFRLIGDKADAVNAAARRRMAREPVSRILGWREFYGRRFEISPATLDPRPDTETLIDAALAVARSPGQSGKPLRILDVGTGSGCLLITLLAELKDATGIGTDIDPETLQVAGRNAVTHGVWPRMSLRMVDGLDGIDERFDILIANPPYIPTSEICGLEPEVSQYDPAVALDGGPDGLAHYRRLIEGLVSVVPKGYAFLEIGSNQARDVMALLQAKGAPVGWLDPTVICDLSGNTRCVAQKTLGSSCTK